MDDETRELVKRTTNTITGWHAQLLNNITPQVRLSDRFYTYDIYSEDVTTVNLGKTLNIYILGIHEEFTFNKEIFTGFLVWIQKEVFVYGMDLWKKLSEKLGCFAVGDNCFAGADLIHKIMSDTNSAFSKTLKNWAEDNLVGGRTKLNYYKDSRYSRKWRVEMMISECGITENNDTFFADYFGIQSLEFATADENQADDRFNNLYRYLAADKKEGVVHKRDWAVHAFKLIRLVSARASSLGYNINRYPGEDIDEVLKACVE